MLSKTGFPQKKELILTYFLTMLIGIIAGIIILNTFDLLFSQLLSQRNESWLNQLLNGQQLFLRHLFILCAEGSSILIGVAIAVSLLGQTHSLGRFKSSFFSTLSCLATIECIVLLTKTGHKFGHSPDYHVPFIVIVTYVFFLIAYHYRRVWFQWNTMTKKYKNMNFELRN